MGVPVLTVVVASHGPSTRLSMCLTALLPSCIREGAELIVARADPPGAMLELSHAYPQARFIGAPARIERPDLRSAGLNAASGDVIVLLDDDADPAFAASQISRRSRRSDTPPRDGAALSRPYLSVVVPVHQGAEVLERSLEALARSNLARDRWELIVVDDASTDASTRIAARHADVIVRLRGTPHGPAYARNRGFEFAHGACIAFIDADACIRPDTLSHLAHVLETEPDVDAVFGSCDPGPDGSGLVSRYRNLLIHYYHQQHPGATETFWASCGAIRSEVFAAAGMFDEWHFQRRQVEDSELGVRLRQRGHRIVLRPEIQATHLRQWTLRAMISADLNDGTVPWMRIVEQPRGSPRSSERIRRMKRWNTALTWLALVLLLAALVSGEIHPPLAALVCVGLVLLNNRTQYRFFVRRGSTRLAVAAMPLDLLRYLVNGVAITYGWFLREVIGPPPPPPSVEAYAEVGVQMWPPVPVRPRPPSAEPRDEH